MGRCQHTWGYRYSQSYFWAVPRVSHSSQRTPHNIADVQAVGDEVTRHALAIDDGERLASVEKKEDIMSVYHCAPHVFNGKGERAVHDQNK